MRFLIIPRRHDQWFWEMQNAEGATLSRSAVPCPGMAETKAAIEEFKFAVLDAGCYDLHGDKVGRQ